MAELFVPCEELPGTRSRGAVVVDRIVALDETAVEHAYREVLEAYARRRAV